MRRRDVMKLMAAGAMFPLPAFAQSSKSDSGPIRIGVLNDQSSVYSVDGGVETVEAVKMACEDAGEVLGHKVEVVAADHQNKADLGASIARRWFERDGVDAVADVTNSSVGFAVQALSTEKKKIALTVGAVSSDFTGKSCSPYLVAWGQDTWSLANIIGSAVIKNGGDTWYFVGVDYGFGHAMVKDTSAVVRANGGKVLGSVFAPLNTSDFSSFILQAQASKAKIVGLANSSGDTLNCIKQAAEFGLVKRGQKLVAYIIMLSHIKSLTLPVAQGLLVANSFYWDLNEETRAWSKRFADRVGHPPDFDPANNYSAVAHYLKAVKAVGSRDPDAVMAKMRELPVNDFMTKNGKLRLDGRLERPMYLLEVKSPEESKHEWDIYKVVETIPGASAFRPMSEGNCPLVKG